MVRDITLYIHNLPIDCASKGLLSCVAELKLKGRTVQPGYKELAKWISRSRRTVATCLNTLELMGYLRRKRRGKKLTNVYYLAHFLWGLLTNGRSIPKRYAKEKPDDLIGLERAKDLFSELYAALDKRRRKPVC
tara:strand:+ start:36 stop:437 length:402 start_codon:yes stop_codon:yes gene_type:complete